MVSHPAILAAIRTRRALRMEYQDHLEAAYQRAESDCAGVLLNRRGQDAWIDPFTLFYGPHARVEAYASRELGDWFRVHGRMTFEDFEHAMGVVPGRQWGILARAEVDR